MDKSLLLSPIKEKYKEIYFKKKVFFNPFSRSQNFKSNQYRLYDRIPHVKYNNKIVSTFYLKKINVFSKSIKNSPLKKSQQSSLKKLRKRRKKIKKKVLTKKIKKRNNSCNCKFSECLKLYCECFRYKGYCHSSCNCVGCKNTKQFDEKRIYNLKRIECKNP